jgi:hypothetical protein
MLFDRELSTLANQREVFVDAKLGHGLYRLFRLNRATRVGGADVGRP